MEIKGSGRLLPTSRLAVTWTNQWEVVPRVRQHRPDRSGQDWLRSIPPKRFCQTYRRRGLRKLGFEIINLSLQLLDCLNQDCDHVAVADLAGHWLVIFVLPIFDILG